MHCYNAVSPTLIGNRLLIRKTRVHSRAYDDYDGAVTIIIKLDDGPKKGVLCKLSSCCRVLQLWSLKFTINLYLKITKYGGT